MTSLVGAVAGILLTVVGAAAPARAETPAMLKGNEDMVPIASRMVNRCTAYMHMISGVTADGRKVPEPEAYAAVSQDLDKKEKAMLTVVCLSYSKGYSTSGADLARVVARVSADGTAAAGR